MEIGMIGLGRMGGNMAQRLLKATTGSSPSTKMPRRCHPTRPEERCRPSRLPIWWASYHPPEWCG